MSIIYSDEDGYEISRERYDAQLAIRSHKAKALAETQPLGDVPQEQPLPLRGDEMANELIFHLRSRLDEMIGLYKNSRVEIAMLRQQLNQKDNIIEGLHGIIHRAESELVATNKKVAELTRMREGAD